MIRLEVDKDILRLDVPMENALQMCLMNSARHLLDVPGRPAVFQRSFLQERCKAVTIDESHGKKVVSFEFTNLVNRDNVVVFQSSGRLSLKGSPWVDTTSSPRAKRNASSGPSVTPKPRASRELLV